MECLRNLLRSLLFPAVVMIVSFSAHEAPAVPSGAKIVYEGQGAGEVIFDGSVHAAKGLTCAMCHEGNGFVPATFAMQKYGSFISMRKMEIGRSCGTCHPVDMKDMSSCSFCHHK